VNLLATPLTKTEGVEQVFELEDGTYLKLSETNLVKIETNQGYWVGITEADLASVYTGHLVGVWRDKDTGKTWVDVVEYRESLGDAVELARHHNQIAIWDNANGVEVRL
jgi:hypothetical protein